MNHRTHAPRPAPGAVLALLLTLLLPACSGAAGGPVSDEPPLAGSPMNGRFTLTNQDGQRISDTVFAGKYRLTYIGFANCPDVCPVDLAVMGQGLRRFEEKHPERAARVQPIFITVDPERDTPAVLKPFVANFHPRLVGLTGSRAEIDAVVRAHGGSAIKGESRAGGGYNVDHSRYILLMGPQAEPIAIIPHESPEALEAELGKWVR
jgi:protein SCO1/2